MTEAKIGSLPWFCGVWWLLLSLVCQGAVRVVLKLHLPNSWAWKALKGGMACNKLAFQCAIEAGAKDE